MASAIDLPVPSRGAVEVVAPGRLHLGMLSFGNPAVRAYGGLGVMIERPGVVLRVFPAARIAATGPLADRAEGFARGCAAAWGLAGTGCRIEVIEVPPSHVGLGSGTQLALAVAAGMRRLCRSPVVGQPGHDPADEAVALARAVGRGRRSSVGVYGFAAGGLILEGGRLVPVDRGDEQDATRPFSPLVSRVLLPEAWRCILFSLRGVSGLCGDDEKRAFARLPPVPVELTAELARIAVLELLPAAIEGRFDAFADAVRRYGMLAGKPFEPVSSRLPQTEITSRLFAKLESLGASGAAQSSWGPTVMTPCPSESTAEDLVARFAATDLAERYDTAIVRFDRRGAIVRDLPR